MRTPAPRPPARTVWCRPAVAAGRSRFSFELNLETLELRCDGRPVELRPQAVQALELLLRCDGRLVTFDQLREALWGDLHLEWRNSLHQCVRDLRRALSDDARRPRLVASVARRGYRFVGEQQPAEELVSGSGRFMQAFRRPSLAFAAGLATAVLVPASFFVLCVVLAG